MNKGNLFVKICGKYRVESDADGNGKGKAQSLYEGTKCDLDEIYDKFGVDYDLLSLLTRREADSEGKLHIRWGDQNVV